MISGEAVSVLIFSGLWIAMILTWYLTEDEPPPSTEWMERAAAAAAARRAEAFEQWLHRPRLVSVGRGRWRLVAWGQVRLSPGTRGLLAVGLAIALVAGGWYGLEVASRHPDLVLIVVLIVIPIIWAVACGLGIVAALCGMRRAWRSGERHRWPERWSERPHDEVTGLVPRPPDAPPVPSRPGATRGGRRP
jgi:hypothetical protein